jgi:hypothetical protein
MREEMDKISVSTKAVQSENGGSMVVDFRKRVFILPIPV